MAPGRATHPYAQDGTKSWILVLPASYAARDNAHVTPPRTDLRVLLVDDERLICASLRRLLGASGFQVSEANTVAGGIAALERELPDLLLLDYHLPDGIGLEVLQAARKLAPGLPVVMITAHASIHGAVEAIRLGAYDYIAKPFEQEDLLQTIGRALETSQLRDEVAHHRDEGRRDFAASSLIAESPAMKEVLQLIERVASSEATTILLLGESGVGKGLIARALHYQGTAASSPFLDITCTALPENLLESELFGHEKGAFTDARAQKKGLLELAEGGTAFLDEIGDLSGALQGKLLRFLEEKSFRRVGGTRDIRLALRIVAATNKDLEREVAEGRFRPDLYFRLKVIPIEIPPLRHRREDVTPLVQSFVQHFNHEFHKTVRGFEPAALRLLQDYPWPGNVRELRNAVERAVLLSRTPVLGAADLPSEITGPRRAQPAGTVGASFALPRGGIVLEELERDLLRQALTTSHGNRTRAARLLGLNRDQIRYRIEKFGLEREFAPPSAPEPDGDAS
ncbi:MAG: sigma-54-dependent Fis family transcriptional regulator [Planctomycetes bacterium]|nr:sigma-54-dependent Fis family transcriptional regulator [Planctomycetota bacterium]